MNIKKIVKCGVKYMINSEYRFLINSGFGLHNSMSDEKYLARRYNAIVGKKLNLEDPKTFNEKLQWLKLYNRRPEYTMMADKVAVRDYIAKTIGEEYLIPCLGVWDDPDDIDFNTLPDQFVLKCNHNSGLGMCICKDKSKLDIEKVKAGLRKGLKQNYYLSGREWPYKNIKPRIIVEKYMTDESGTELKDYKVMCFDGKPKLIQVHKGRFVDHTQDFYDTDWNFMKIYQGCKNSDQIMPKPDFLEEMLSLSETLATGIPHVRVDWYFVNGQLYFGELTFFDASGFDEFEPNEYNEILGSWITLPEVKNT